MSEKVGTKPSSTASIGVESLINRLRDEGVGAGQAESEKIIREAREKAALIKSQAQQEAEQIVSSARKQAAAFTSAGQDALMLAGRDAHLKLREVVMSRFNEEVQRLVGSVMAPEPFMEKLILQLVGNVRDATGLDKQDKLTIVLPENTVSMDELRSNPEELKEGTLAHFVLSIMASLLKEGISYQPSGDINAGLKIYLDNGDVEVDLSDEAISAVLLEHLQPRFRALLEGVVK
jgi:V/A-type H+-transporting ATPase subunit E